MANTGPVYAFLRDLEVVTTKTAWPLRGPGEPEVGGDTCQDPEYLDWALGLQEQGFEIAWHLATYHSSRREMTGAGLARFRELFGAPPRSMANHLTNREALYWGNDRLTGWRRLLLRLATAGRRGRRTLGHVEGSEYFWGDLARAQITYFRNLVFPALDTLAACPWMPYRDPAFPFLNRVFAASEGPDIAAWNRLVTRDAIDRLADAGGAAIVYTHFAKGFYDEASGQLDPTFATNLEYLASKGGWYVPVSTLLDHLADNGRGQDIDPRARAGMEWAWLRWKLRHGSS